MKPLVAAVTITLVGATGCATVPQVAQRDYAHSIVGSWLYTGTYGGETFLTVVNVFHADGRWGVRSLDLPGLEDIRGRRWRIDGDKLFMIGPDDHRLGSDHRRLASMPERIVSFTADKFVTINGLTGTYTRIQKRRKTPNHAMERTATRRAATFRVAWTPTLRPTRAIGGRRSSYSR